MNQLKRNRFFICLFLLLASSVDAQIASWNPSGLSAYGPSPWAPTATAAGISVGGLTRGAGLATTGSPVANAWGAVNWAGAANQDATFTVSANPGYTVSFSSFNLSYRRSNTGPNAGTLEYTFGSSSTYTVISTLTSLTSTVTTGVPITPVNLSSVADLQNVPPGTVVKFRIFPTGGSSVGTFYVYGPAGMSLGGTVTGPASAFTSTITQTAPVLCHGQAAATLSVNATGGTLPYTYSWSPSGGTSDVAGGLSAGVYTCVVTSASSATTMSTYTVTEPAPLSSTLSAQANVSCFSGSDGSATFTVNGGILPYTYSWSPSGGNAATATGLTAGAYTLTMTDANGCVLSPTLAITQPPVLTLTVAATSSAICNGSPVTLTATGANTYTWTNGVSNGVAFSPSLTATYTVNGTDGNGCNGSAAVSVTVNALPALGATTNKGILCPGQTATLTASGALSYTWSTAQQTAVIAVSPTITTTYTLSGTGANGCTASISVVQNVSTCTGIEDVSATGPEIRFYPNPNKGSFTVSAGRDMTLSLVNSLGGLVRTISLSEGNEHRLQIEGLSQGVYFLVCKEASYTMVQKIVVTE